MTSTRVSLYGGNLPERWAYQDWLGLIESGGGRPDMLLALDYCVLCWGLPTRGGR
jgi:hypothetical protein